MFGGGALRLGAVWRGAMRCDVVWCVVLGASRNVLYGNVCSYIALQLVCGVLHVDCVASYWRVMGCDVVWCVVIRRVVMRCVAMRRGAARRSALYCAVLCCVMACRVVVSCVVVCCGVVGRVVLCCVVA